MQNERKSVAPSCGIVGLSPTVMGNRPSARRAPAAPTEIKAVDPITLKWKLKTERSKPVSPATLATLVAKEDLAQELEKHPGILRATAFQKRSKKKRQAS